MIYACVFPRVLRPCVWLRLSAAGCCRDMSLHLVGWGLGQALPTGWLSTCLPWAVENRLTRFDSPVRVSYTLLRFWFVRVRICSNRLGDLREAAAGGDSHQGPQKQLAGWWVPMGLMWTPGLGAAESPVSSPGTSSQGFKPFPGTHGTEIEFSYLEEKGVKIGRWNHSWRQRLSRL